MRQYAERQRDDEQETLSFRTEPYTFVPVCTKRRNFVGCQLTNNSARARADGANDAVVQDKSDISPKFAVAVSIEPNIAPHATHQLQYK